jgi:integrase
MHTGIISIPNNTKKMSVLKFILSDCQPIKRYEWRNKVLNRALKKAGPMKITVEYLRQTYATLRIAAGHNIVNVAKQLGHASVKTAQDVYAAFVPDSEQK